MAEGVVATAVVLLVVIEVSGAAVVTIAVVTAVVVAVASVLATTAALTGEELPRSSCGRAHVLAN